MFGLGYLSSCLLSLQPSLCYSSLHFAISWLAISFCRISFAGFQTNDHGYFNKFELCDKQNKKKKKRIILILKFKVRNNFVVPRMMRVNVSFFLLCKYLPRSFLFHRERLVCALEPSRSISPLTPVTFFSTLVSARRIIEQAHDESGKHSIFQSDPGCFSAAIKAAYRVGSTRLASI